MRAMQGLVLALAILGGCSKDGGDAANKAAASAKTTATPGAEATPTTAEPATPAFVSKAGRFSVGRVFGTPEEKDMTDPQGVVWPSVNWTTKKSMFSAQYADFASPELALAEMRAFKMTNNPAEMSRDEEKTFQGRPGREMMMKTSSGMAVTIRFIVDGSRVYKAMGGTKVEHDNVTAFIDSMKIDGEPAAAAPAPTAAAPTGAEAENLEAGRQVVALFKEVSSLGQRTSGNCEAFNTGIDPIRTRLWDLGKAHPGVMKDLSNDELKSLGAADAMDEASQYLMACKDSVHAKEFAFAIGKVLNATPEERAAAAKATPAPTPAPTEEAAPAAPAAKRKVTTKAAPATAAPAPAPPSKAAAEKARAKSLEGALSGDL